MSCKFLHKLLSKDFRWTITSLNGKIPFACIWNLICNMFASENPYENIKWEKPISVNFYLLEGAVYE